jgi:hypothetical protein
MTFPMPLLDSEANRFSSRRFSQANPFLEQTTMIPGHLTVKRCNHGSL